MHKVFWKQYLELNVAFTMYILRKVLRFWTWVMPLVSFTVDVSGLFQLLRLRALKILIANSDLTLSTTVHIPLVHFSIVKIFDDFLMMHSFISTTVLLSLSLSFRIQFGWWFILNIHENLYYTTFINEINYTKCWYSCLILITLCFFQKSRKAH